jgi:hypothetical protein
MIYSICSGVKVKKNNIAQNLLRDLETSAKTVKCRKQCKCSDCGNIIQQGETALKTVQRYRNTEFWYNNFCSDCYQEIN